MLNLTQELRLQQKLSPQQIQYIKLLQLPALALEQRIQEELQANPVLEEGPLVEDLTPSDESDDSPSDDDYDWTELLPAGDELYGHKASVDQEVRESPLPATESLSDYLRSQKAFLDLDPQEALIADQIIGSIDEDGYLRREPASIVDDLMFNMGLDLNESDVLQVLARVQRLDPVGIAARNLQECLQVQLEAMPADTPGRSLAVRVVAQGFEAFSRKRFGWIKERFDVDDRALKEAADLIRRCNPKPGEGAFTPSQNYLVPDFLVKRIDDKFTIQLSAGNMPTLHVSPAYRSMLEQEKTIDDGAKRFIRGKFEAAKWFIDSIQQRRRTMLVVMREIVAAQEAFFTFGEGNLRPLVLRDIAERVSMDISTISRVVSGKYVQCDFGVYELKYFFSEGVATASGAMVSNREVKAVIAAMIRDENKAEPLADQVITDRLKERGLRIARRTVSKYREQLGLPVARLRREIVVD